MRLLQLVIFVSLVLSLGACSKSDKSVQIPSEPSPALIPAGVHGPAVVSGAGHSTDSLVQIPLDASEIITLSNGAKIVVLNRAGKMFHAVEGTLSDRAFTSVGAAIASLSSQQRIALMDRELDKLLAELHLSSAIALKKYPEVGYFTFLLPYSSEVLSALKTRQFSHELLLNPVISDPDTMKNIKAMTPAAEGLVAKNSPRGATKNFSGLERMRTPEFVKLAESEIGNGATVDGSGVMLGITDTGITYNHRTFLAKDRKSNRIVYMKDFTRESRVYFSPSAKFEAKAVEGSDTKILISAQVIVTPNLPNMPAGDKFLEMPAVPFTVSPELRAVLLAPGTKARLGFLLESTLNSAGSGERNDINANGKMDDILPMILVPGDTAESDVLYADMAGVGDLSKVPAVKSWNSSGQMLSVFAEKFGFDIQDDVLPDATGKERIAVKSVSIIGFDPGNHGSHVAGIAAGRKTIANDDEDTLARGVAPAAKILMSRVCAINTGCNATEAFVDLALNGGAEVINMSLGGLNPFNDGYGVEAALINRITSLKSVLFVISAGNSGPGRQTVGSPSVARLSLSVGASATKGLIQRQYQWPGAGSTKAEDMDADFMLFFSSRGPTAAGGFKPNISAPGTELSSLQLNSAPGARGGLDVYWGTSMSAPAATGAYALLLDAVKKYNTAYPEKALPADAVTLREVMIQSARPFDMNSFDPETGVHSTGQYTWMDQGMGMVDLVAAWKKLQEVRDNQLPISEDDVPVDLEYNVIVSMKNPTGTAYDGSRSGTPAIPELGINQPAPAFGTGLYLDVRGLDTLRSVYIQRKLPDVVATSELAGELTRRLLDTRDEFVLKTMIYGSNKLWIKAGVLNEIDCWDSETANLTIMGRGVDIAPNEDGSATINPFNASRMNVCINREMIANELPPGDHGALIAGYRFVNGKTASLPSFTVPVSLTIPQQTLAHSNALEVNSKVNSFGVARSYVMVPAGTSLVQLTLEVPAVKTTESGLMLRGEKCSGVELMALKGGNTAGVFKTRADARISNCDATGTPSDKNRKLVFSAVDPKPGIWDLHVFGQYAYAESVYKLRVDYINSASDVQIVEGDLSALVGSLGWAATDSTLPAVPDLGQSSFFVDSLVSSSSSQVRKGEFVIVENPQGQLRTYPEGVKKVTVTTGSSPGNDIDLLILQCVPPSVLNPEPQACTQIASSGGAADDESASFMPDPRFVYLVRVDGYSVKDEGKFVSMETLAYDPEFGRLEFNSHGSKVQVSYSLTPAELEKGKLVNSTAYKSGKYKLAGAIVLKMANGTLLNKIPVKVTPQIAELTY